MITNTALKSIAKGDFSLVDLPAVLLLSLL